MYLLKFHSNIEPILFQINSISNLIKMSFLLLLFIFFYKFKYIHKT